MMIEPGLVVVIAATLIFYLRLIVLQRERVRQSTKNSQEEARSNHKRNAKSNNLRTAPPARYSILSPRRVDRLIATIGIIAILIGLLYNRGLLPPELLQVYWWAPTAVGIVAFSWAFRL